MLKRTETPIKHSEFQSSPLKYTPKAIYEPKKYFLPPQKNTRLCVSQLGIIT